MSNEQLLVRCARPHVLIFYVRMRSNTTSYYYSTSRQFLSLFFFFFWMTLLLFLAMNALLMTTSALMRVPFHTPYLFLLLLSPIVDPRILFRVDNVVIRLGFFFFFEGGRGILFDSSDSDNTSVGGLCGFSHCFKNKMRGSSPLFFSLSFFFCSRDVELNLLNKTYYIQKRRTYNEDRPTKM